MTDVRNRLTRGAAWALSALVLIGAWFVVADTPTLAEKRSSFDVSAPPPDWGEGRNVKARAVGATFADEIGYGGWLASANWFVVQIEAAAVVDPAVLRVAELEVDGVTYTSTDRTFVGINNQKLLVGVPVTGVLAFELPNDLRSGTAEIRLGEGPDQRLDSIIVMPIDLGEMTRVPTVMLFPAQFPTT